MNIEPTTQNESWKAYAADFNAMSDDEIESERQSAQCLVDEQQEWLDAVALWEAAGKPREPKTMKEPTQAE